MAPSYTPDKLSYTRAALATNLECSNALILRYQIGNHHGWILKIPRIFDGGILIRLLRRWVLLVNLSIVSCLYLATLNPGSFFHLWKLLQINLLSHAPLGKLWRHLLVLPSLNVWGRLFIHYGVADKARVYTPILLLTLNLRLENTAHNLLYL